jgi:hypothetical protein
MTENKMPEDSTTRRHYETHLRMMGSGGSTSSAQGGSRSGPAPARPTQSASSGGFMGWLKRLFGG